MKLTDLTDDYLKFIKIERGLSQRTTSQYQSWLRHFLNWLQENGYPEPELTAFSVPVLRRFLYFLAGKNYRPRTIRGVFAPLKGLGAFLVTNGVIAENPTKALSMPKRDAAERKMTSDAEVTALLAAAQKIHPPRRAALCYAVVATLAFSGVRRNELLALKMEDVNTSEQSILVRHGKGEKSRKVWLPDEGATALREWLALRGQAKHSWLFAYDSNRRLGENGLKALIEEVKTVAGLRDAQHILPHSIRHNFATRILRAGADIRAVQAALGHSSLAVTSQYLHADEEHQRSVAQLAAIKPKAPPAPSQTPLPVQKREESRYRRLSGQGRQQTQFRTVVRYRKG